MNRAFELFLERQFAAELFAGSFCNVIPFFRRLVSTGLSGTGMGSGGIGTIVLARFGHAIAFFLAGRLVRGKSVGCPRHCNNAGQGGTYNKLLVHADLLGLEERESVDLCLSCTALAG